MNRKQSNTELDRLRAGRSEVENHYIDELVSGRLDRRTFLRRGSMIGMSVPLMGAVLAACGSSSSSTPSSSSSSSGSAGTPKKGGTLRIALSTPAAAVNPLTVDDAGGLCMLGQTGEFLIFDSNLKLALQPMLATKWTPNSDGSVWTFLLRPGVTFNNGQKLTAADVVYTFQQLADPKNASNALSALIGVLESSGVKAVDATTVQFTLQAPNGNFPYLVSSDNYNAIIVPAGTDYSKWQSTFVGTGAFKLGTYTQGVGATFVANPNYWGGKPYLDGTQFKFFASQQPQILALEGNEVDVIAQFVPAGATSLLNSSSYKIIRLISSNHRELSMRNDVAPFTDARVRQAVAYTLDRPAMVSALLDNFGSVANDYPFGPRFASTDTSIPQRTQNIAKAKQLLSAAGHPNGFSTNLKTEIYEEVPQLAQVIKAYAAKAGINISLTIESQDAYYGKATFGNSDWLDGTMSLVDYGDRGVPNVFLTAPLTTSGPWNAARFHNSQYDKLVKQYVAALDIQSQRSVAGQIQTLLLNETPIIYPYWIDGLTASIPTVFGLNPTSIAQLYLNNAYISEAGHRQRMAAFILKRIGLALITLWILSVIVFFVGQILPGDPGRSILGPLAAERAVRTLDRQLGLDRPLLTQYWVWISHFVRGEPGTSYQYQAPIGPLLLAALERSIKLGVLAFVIVVPLAIAGGVVAALNVGKPIDRVISVVGLSGTTVPEFVSGIVLILVFGICLDWLPIEANPPQGTGFVGSFRYLIMPAIPLVLILFGYIMRMARVGTVEALESDYARTATLKGLPRGVMIRRHVLRNSLLPTITVIATQTGYLIGGLVVVETLFRYQGIGSLVVTAATNKDFPMLEAGVLTIGIVYMVVTLVADVAFSLLNPRIRLASAE